MAGHRGSAPAIGVTVLLALVACQPDQSSQLTVTNNGDRAVSLFEQRTGGQRSHLGDVAAGASSAVAIPDNGCIDAVLTAVRPDGSTSAFGPPLCAGQSWHVQ